MTIRSILMAAPVAALSLVLASISPSARSASKGLPIRPVGMGPCGMHDDVRIIVIVLTADGQVKINSEESSWNGLGPRLEEILRTRWEKLVYVTADPDVPFQRVATAIDIAQGSAYHVGLLPPIGRTSIGRSICPEVHLHYDTAEPETNDRSLRIWH